MELQCRAAVAHIPRCTDLLCVIAYLTELLRSRSLVALPVVMQFLSVPDSVRPMLTRHIHRVDSDNEYVDTGLYGRTSLMG